MKSVDLNLVIQYIISKLKNFRCQNDTTYSPHIKSCAAKSKLS